MLYFRQIANSDSQFKVQGDLETNSTKLAMENGQFDKSLTNYKREMCREMNRALFNNDQERNCSHEDPTIVFPSLKLILNSITNKQAQETKLLPNDFFDLFKKLTMMLTSFTTAMINQVQDSDFIEGSKSDLERIAFQLDDCKTSFRNKLSIYDLHKPDIRIENDTGSTYSFSRDVDHTLYTVHIGEKTTDLEIKQRGENRMLEFKFDNSDTELDECMLKIDTDIEFKTLSNYMRQGRRAS